MIEDNFHATISCSINKDIAVLNPKKNKQFKPILAKPSSENFRTIPRLSKDFLQKRHLDDPPRVA